MSRDTLVFSPIKFDINSLKKYEELFLTCFPKSSKFTPATLSWLYVDNPEGCAIGFDAYDGDMLVAHYVCIPTLLNVHGRLEKSLLSLNTATHPLYQGMGLFTKLAAMTYESATSLGFSSVHGVANYNSTPGFVRRLGFQLIGKLEAKLGFGNLCLDSEVYKEASFYRIWGDELLAWRCANPSGQVYCNNLEHGLSFRTKAFGGAISVVSELPGAKRDLFIGNKINSPAHLFIGLVPNSMSKLKYYINIPEKFRPSPLNLIYLSFSVQSLRIDLEDVLFTFLDFDAF